MERYLFGCQTITFGPEQRKVLPEVFAAVSRAGFSGLEIGFRHIAHLSPKQLLELQRQAGIPVIATHVGGNLDDRAQANAERGVLDDVLAAARTVGFGLVFYSGLRYESEEQFSGALAMLNRGAQRAAAAGVTLAYHNHDWEFADQGRVFSRLLAEGAPELKLCPDLGWLHRAGVDVVGFLAEHQARLAAVHFKDYRRDGERMRFVTLGTGEAPLREAAAWMKARALPARWIIAEQDRADGVSPAEAVSRNALFLKEVFA